MHHSRTKFDQRIEEKIGPAAQTADFPDEDLTPEHDAHLDHDHPDPDTDDLEVTPEIGDNYMGASIKIPCGGVLTSGKVTATARKRNARGNPIGRAHTNPILDTREYTVEFDDQDVTELTANQIAVSMYAQCDPEGNQ